MKSDQQKEITNDLSLNPFEGWNQDTPLSEVPEVFGENNSEPAVESLENLFASMESEAKAAHDLASPEKSSMPEMVESQYSRTFNAEYNYEPEGEHLFKEEVSKVSSKKNNSKNKVQDKKDYSRNTVEGEVPQIPKRRYQTNLANPFERVPLTEYHRALNYEDFYDVDEYLRLADEREVITHQELIKYPENPPKHTGYDPVSEPKEFIGRLAEVRSLNDASGRRRHYCFVTLGLDKFKLVAFRKDTGAYSPSYDKIDLTNAEIGSYWWCKADYAVQDKEKHKITWYSAKELKAPCLRDIFQNPDPKFRPEGWLILNDKIIFDPNLIKGKTEVDLEEFNLTLQEGKTPKYYGTIEGMLG